MRYEVKATTDVNRSRGDRHFDTKKGETLELSSAGAQIVMSESFEGDYEIVREIPERPREIEAVKQAEELAKLMSQPKEKLVKQAERLDIPNAGGLLKAPLADAITEAKQEAQTATKQPTEASQTVARQPIATKTKK